MQRKKKIRLVHVTWVDSSSSRGWRSLEDFKQEEMLVCESIGWLLDRNRERILIAGTRCDNDDWAERHTIPMACVKKIRRLQRGVK